MNVSCQCRSVNFQTPTPQPLALYICHCSACRTQTGSAFGTSAIFPKFSLPADEKLAVYAYFCKTCGTRLVHSTPVSHHPFTSPFFPTPSATLTTGNPAKQSKNVVSVKGGCIEGLDWSTAIHLWTKSAMVPIPEGCETHSESSTGTSDYGDTQEVLDQPGDLACSGYDPTPDV
ncbi:hypothetical protein jhhlp_004504 [Lomentospora prolificans]|uniref:CENP-V/GFA domain-containing protein n=1 Tax=Lomentospora prolificans TaxID=41688 RepID=A0A2N3NBU6_9PEZI|nr:hypothetical protein jhhlp_004504 [Lomentospora prolificans]